MPFQSNIFTNTEMRQQPYPAYAGNEWGSATKLESLYEFVSYTKLSIQSRDVPILFSASARVPPPTTAYVSAT